MKNDISYELSKYIFFTTIFLLSFILFHNQVYAGFQSDLTAHIAFIDGIINGQKFMPHPLFHYISYYTSKMFFLDIKTSSIIVNALLVLFLSVVILTILNMFLKENINRFLKLFLVFIVMFSGTFFLAGLGLTKHQYLGNGSISIWHNVTLNMVNPFGFLSFFIFFYVIEKQKNETMWFMISFVFAIVSIFAKPSFIVVFLPIILLFVAYKKLLLKQNIHNNLFKYTIGLLVVSTIILWYQASMTYNPDEASNIIIAPFEVWNLYSNNILISFVIGNLFVVFYTLLCFRFISQRSLFSLIMLLGGVILFMFFAETGSRFSHANFSWSYILVMKLVYLSFIIDFVNNSNKIKNFKKRILIICLSVHLIFGLFYFINIFLGGSYF